MNVSLALRSSFLFIGVHAIATGLLAQQNTRPFGVELSASAGGTFDLPGATAYSGICDSLQINCSEQTRPGKKFLPTVNAGVVVSLNRWIGLYGEYGRILPDSNRTSVTFGQNKSDVTTADRHYWVATGGAEFRFPTVHGVVPILRIGAGNLHDSYNYYDVGVNVTPPIIHFSDARGIIAITTGGGIKWYLRERQGLRFMANGMYLGHSVIDIQRSSLLGSTAFIARRSGGSVTGGYFIQLGR